MTTHRTPNSSVWAKTCVIGMLGLIVSQIPVSLTQAVGWALAAMPAFTVQ